MGMSGSSRAWLLWMVVIVGILASLAAWGIHREKTYLESTTPAQRAAHRALEVELEAAPDGAFIVLPPVSDDSEERVWCVSSNPKPEFRRGSIKVQTYPSDGLHDRDVRFLARVVERVVLPDDDGWPAMARRYLSE